jgi:predicted Zn-ribbon and HTH transcriptional regulator
MMRYKLKWIKMVCAECGVVFAVPSHHLKVVSSCPYCLCGRRLYRRGWLELEIRE